MTRWGDACIDRNSIGFADLTIIFKKTTLPAGHISQWECYINGNCNATLKVFRDDGTNYIFIGETSATAVITGLNSGLSADITILSGDYVGLYLTDSGNIEVDTGATSSIDYRAGNISSNTLKSTWTGSTYGNGVSLGVYIDGTDDIFIDINKTDDTGNGYSWVTAKKTLSAGYAIVTSAGTIHAASGTYSKSGITFNKSFKLSCEDPNGEGYKRVLVGA